MNVGLAPGDAERSSMHGRGAMIGEGRNSFEGLEHRAARVSLVNGLSTVLTLIFQLVSVPVCLKFWGKESYGGWLALLSAFMLLRSLDGGFALFVGNKLNVLYHRDTAALRLHLASAAAGIIVVSGLQLLLAFGALGFEPLARMLGMPIELNGDRTAQIGLVVLVVSWATTGSYVGIVHRLLIPAGMMYQSAWWAMAFQVVQFAAIMAAAGLRLGLLQTSALFAASQILIYVSSAIYVRKALPAFSPWLRGATISVGVRDLAHSIMLTASNVVQQVATNGIVLSIAALAGPIAVPIFTTVRTLTNLWTAVTTVLTAPLLPEVVRLHAIGETAKLGSLNEVYWVLVGSAVNFGALLFFPLMPFIYAQWTAHAVVLNEPLLALMLGGVVITNWGALMALHLNGINSLRIVLGASVARAGVALGGGILLYRSFGLAGFGLSILLGELSAALLTARHFIKRELAQNRVRVKFSSYGPAGAGTGSTLLFFVGRASGWWSGTWVWVLALAAVSGCFLWGWKGLDSDLRTRLLGLATRWRRSS
jgi:O-antigen/teichoic acid export membrane protein